MGWFDEQVKQKKQRDSEDFSESFVNIAGAVIGSKISATLNNDRQITKNAIDEILKYYHAKSRVVPDNIKEASEQLEYLMRPYGIMRRKVLLEKNWYKDAVGAMLGTRTDDGSAVALIPRGLFGYSFLDVTSGKKVYLGPKTENLIAAEATCFYKPFP